MALTQKHCIPCRKGAKPLTAEAAKLLLKELDGWRISKCGMWLRKSYAFTDFTQALAFTNHIGKTAEAENHHPDIKLGWGYVDISLQTHAAGGLHENDFILAAKIDAIQ